MALIRLIVTMLIVAAAADRGSAAEIRLKSQCVVRDSIVTLSDVAELIGDESTKLRLGRLELFPAPPRGRAKRVSRQVVLEWLALRGVEPGSHRVTGAALVSIRRPLTTLSSSQPAAAFPPSGKRTVTGSAASRASFTGTAHASTLARRERVLIQQAGGRVATAVHEYLTQHAGATAHWKVQVQLTAHQAALIPARVRSIQIDGGQAPWAGNQQFTIAFQPGRDQRTVQFPVTATIELPPMVVVAARRIRKGEVLRALDVRLAQSPMLSSVREGFDTISEVVGKETMRTFAPGQPLAVRSVRPPLLVKRGDAVVVIARAPGVRVRTYGKALQDGRMNDLVRIEPNELNKRRETFVARVVGPRRAEVFAGGPQFETNRADAAAPVVRSARRRDASGRLQPATVAKRPRTIEPRQIFK